jgi:chemotaxis protein CheD
MKIEELPVIFLNQGDFFISNQPCVVKTILGSCISLVIYDPEKKIGGICHAMHPENPKTDENRNFFYADTAIQEIMNYFIVFVIAKEKMDISLYGGSSVVKTTGVTKFNPGNENIRSAIKTLDSFGIKPSVMDTGGDYGRKLLFYPHTGEVIVKKIPILSALKHQTFEKNS